MQKVDKCLHHVLPCLSGLAAMFLACGSICLGMLEQREALQLGLFFF